MPTTTSLSVVQPPPLTYAGCATPHHQMKKTILFVCLPWHPFLLRCWCLLSPYPSWHAPSGSSSVLPLWVVCHPSRTLPQKSLNRNLKIGFPLSPPPNHALLPLIHDLTVSCIGWVQASEAWALRVPLFHVCPKSACCSCVCRGWPAQSAVHS